MPCRSAAPDVATWIPSAGQRAEHRRPGPARRRVGGHPDRLVHDDDVGVDVQHRRARPPAAGIDRERPGAARAGSTPARSPAPAARSGRRSRRRCATSPASIMVDTVVRLIPSSRARPASTRMPTRPSGTGTRRKSGIGDRSRLASPAAGSGRLRRIGCRRNRCPQRGDHQQDSADGDGRVGHVEHREVLGVRPEHRDEVDDVTRKNPGSGRSGRSGCRSRRRGSVRGTPPTRSIAAGWRS